VGRHGAVARRARYNQARAVAQCRFTVMSETPRNAAT
jgi:hypothetical protein